MASCNAQEEESVWEEIKSLDEMEKKLRGEREGTCMKGERLERGDELTL